MVPVTELAAADGASLSYVSLQILGGEAWSIARLAGRGTADSSLRTFTVGLGASYDRVRADVSVEGKDARSEILSAYLGDGTQVHDIRTLQDHVAPRTTSELLCQGAVAGTSRSVYSGLIRVHRGAVRSDARQTNHNLVLDQGAHADSVPNLDILENDVRCSHASTVGPVDEDQRYYMSRAASRPKWPRGSSCVASSTPSSTARPFPPSFRSCSVRCTSVSTSRWAAEHCPPVSETVALFAIDDLASGEARRFDVSGHRYALVRIDDAFYAVDDECSHEDYSLSEGEVWAAEWRSSAPATAACST